MTAMWLFMLAVFLTPLYLTIKFMFFDERRFGCCIGIHRKYWPKSVENAGTDYKPVLLLVTYGKCQACSWESDTFTILDDGSE